MTDTRTKRPAWKALLGCGLLMTMAGTLEGLMQPVGVSHGYLAAGKDRDAAVAEAAGEFRIAAANILWDKVVDHYHHQYMAEGGDWEKNISLLPLLQTIITLDPHFVEAYQLMGGTILPKTGRVKEGQVILAQGIKNNPYDWEMYREMAILYAWTEHNPDAALPYAEEGLRQANDDFSRNLMTLLCKTLRDRIQEQQSTGKSALTASRPHPPRVPVLPGTARPTRPSASG
jgi:hypothetical protein